MASAALILAGLHLHHLERGDSDLFPESTFPPHNRECSHNGNRAIEGPAMLLVALAWPQHSSVRRAQQRSHRCLETPAPAVPHLDGSRIRVWRSRKAQCSDVGSLLVLVLPGVPSFSGDNVWKPHPVVHALVGFLSGAPDLLSLLQDWGYLFWGEVSPARGSCLLAILYWGAGQVLLLNSPVLSTLVFGLLFVSGWGHLVSWWQHLLVGMLVTGVRLGHLF